MPGVAVNVKELYQSLGRSFRLHELENLCFDFGMELEYKAPPKKPETEAEELELVPEVKFEVAANRADLLCKEGLVRALKSFLEIQKMPKNHIKAINENDRQRVFVKPETKQIRPYILSAVLRGIKFTAASLKSFIDLQDKLHESTCRRRTLAAIGTHDLDTIKGPFTYEALPPADIKFKPLKQDKEYTGVELMKLYENDDKLKWFLPIIKDSPVYPVIYDSNRVVLSLPPIINGEHSKITENTKNVFIEITATDLTRANVALNVIVSLFSEYCEHPFEIEPAEVIYPDGERKEVYPQLESRQIEVGVDYLNRVLSLNLEVDAITKNISKMGLVPISHTDKKIIVEIPPLRSDIIHECDVVEDVGIAHGYNNIPRDLPKTLTVGKQLSINKFCDSLRNVIAQAGYVEYITFTLVSKEELYKFMELKYNEEEVVCLHNPKMLEFEVIRTSLIPGLLKSVVSNKSAELPLKFFEVSDVVLKDSTTETGARNERRLCILYSGKTSGFEKVHGVLDFILRDKLNIKSHKEHGYSLEETNHPSFLEGRCASINIKTHKIGVIGVLHPKVLENYELHYPISLLELNVEALYAEFLNN